MTNKVKVILENLPVHIHGFCYHDEDLNPCIVLNARDTAERQKKTYRHEMRHIEKGEMYDTSYREYTKSSGGEPGAF